MKHNNNLHMDQYQHYFNNLLYKKTNQCPDSGSIQDYVNKTLSKKKAKKMEEHLDFCPFCVQAVQNLVSSQHIIDQEQESLENWNTIENEMDKKFYTSLNSLNPGRPETKIIPSQKKYSDLIKKKWQELLNSLHPGKALNFAASLAIILLLTMYAVAFFSRPEYFHLAEIKSIMNGTLRTGNDSETLVNKGIQSYNQKNYTRALEQFKLFLNKNPDNYTANFYAGLSSLLIAKKGLPGLSYKYDQTRVSEAIILLNRALKNSENNKFYQEDCYWYLGKAYLMSGNVSESQESFKKILNVSHHHLTRKDEAREIVSKLK